MPAARQHPHKHPKRQPIAPPRVLCFTLTNRKNCICGNKLRQFLVTLRCGKLPLADGGCANITLAAGKTAAHSTSREMPHNGA